MCLVVIEILNMQGLAQQVSKTLAFRSSTAPTAERKSAREWHASSLTARQCVLSLRGKIITQQKAQHKAASIT
jgi:hypothetical protein